MEPPHIQTLNESSEIMPLLSGYLDSARSKDPESFSKFPRISCALTNILATPDIHV